MGKENIVGIESECRRGRDGELGNIVYVQDEKEGTENGALRDSRGGMAFGGEGAGNRDLLSTSS